MYAVPNPPDMDAERRISRQKLLGDFQDRLKLNVDRIRNPENFKAVPKTPDKKILRAKI